MPSHRKQTFFATLAGIACMISGAACDGRTFPSGREDGGAAASPVDAGDRGLPPNPSFFDAGAGGADAGRVAPPSFDAGSTPGETPTGDKCEDATEIPVNAGPVAGSTRGESDLYSSLTGCNRAGAAPEAVYRFHLATASELRITVRGSGGFSPRAYVWPGCEGALDQLDCRQGPSEATLEFSAVPPGDYRLFVESAGGVLMGDFDIQIEAAASRLGESCALPIPVSVAGPTFVEGSTTTGTAFHRADVRAGLGPVRAISVPVGTRAGAPQNGTSTRLYGGCGGTADATFLNLVDGTPFHVRPQSSSNFEVAIVTGPEGLSCSAPRPLDVSHGVARDIGIVRDRDPRQSFLCPGTNAVSTRPARVYELEVTTPRTLHLELAGLAGLSTHATVGYAIRSISECGSARTPAGGTEIACGSAPLAAPRRVRADIALAPGRYALYVTMLRSDAYYLNPYELKVSF